MSYVVMVSGAASTLKQQYQIPVYVGAAIVVILAAVTVTFGLNSIVDIIGKIGPAIVAVIFLLNLYSLVKNGGNISANIQAIESESVELTKAGSNWFMSGLSNGGLVYYGLQVLPVHLRRKKISKCW